MESRLEKEMLVSALRLFNQASWPGDDMMLKHVMLLSFAYVFELDAQQCGSTREVRAFQDSIALVAIM